MTKVLLAVLKVLASLRLTVVLMALSALLVFVGTLAQVDAGIYHVQKNYFHALIAWWSPPGADVGWLRVPLPGGYLLGGLLMVNLLAAHSVRFQITLKRLGIFVLHFGLIFLLVGEAGTSMFQIDTQMQLPVGGSSNFTYDIRNMELAVIDPSPAGYDKVYSIPQAAMEREGWIDDMALPFRVKVNRWYANSGAPVPPAHAGPGAQPPANRGIGRSLIPVALERTPGTSDRVDIPSALISIESHKGVPLGTWLVSWHLDGVQPVEVDGVQYLLELRPRRYYKPYTIKLEKFIHERYEGTSKPKHFESKIVLSDPSAGIEAREARIYMNHPLRHNNETLYQASFAQNDTVSILQVVHNPVWWLPYVACVLVAAGMLYQFLWSLWRFTRREVAR